MNTRVQTLPGLAATAPDEEAEPDRAFPEGAFEDLFLAHYPRLVRTLLRLTADPARAEELAADAFCKLYRQRGRPFRDENPAGWLYRTAMNLALDSLRADSRRLRREEQTRRERWRNASSCDPLNRLIAEETRDRVRLVISQLKPLHGQVLLLGSSGYSPKEMAAILGLRTDSLYVLISRAKAQFEKKYLRLYGRTE